MMRSLKLTVLILILAMSHLANARIINGNISTASSQARRFTVFVRGQNEHGVSQGACTGIIIARDMILTAQHCFNPSTATVQVKFGLGGAAGFTHTYTSADFIARTPLVHAPDGPSAYVDGVLTYVATQKAAFDLLMRTRTQLVNSAPTKPEWRNSFSDIAIVKIPPIPDGYEPVEFFRGMIPFGKLVILTGYGVHSRDQTETSRELRWSTARIVGNYAPTAGNTIGWETHSPTNQQSCFGDSGGPLVIADGGKLKLLGVNAFTVNKCANANWYVNGMAHFSFIESAIRALRARGSD